MIDRAEFYHGPDGVCKSLFGGRLNSGQVNTMEAILDEWERRVDLHEVGPVTQLAYILATPYRECGVAMVPVRETFATSDLQARNRLKGVWYAVTNPLTGQSYYGRGLVQLTHYSNYLKMGTLLSAELARPGDELAKVLGSAPIDLTLTPDRALELPVAVWVMFEGMLRADSHVGDFTGHALEEYVNDDETDFVNARKVINGLDHADEIAANAELFDKALQAATA